MQSILRTTMIGLATAALWAALPAAQANAAMLSKPQFKSQSQVEMVNHRRRYWGGYGWRDRGYYPAYRWNRGYYRSYYPAYYPDDYYDDGYYVTRRRVVVDAPYAHVYVGPYGRRIVAPYVDLWIP